MARGSVSIPAVSVQAGGQRPLSLVEEVTWSIPEETPVALTYNGVSHAVMMATPRDLADFALGFSLSEGLIHDPAAVEEITPLPPPPTQRGIMVALSITPQAMEAITLRRRQMVGQSGCGLCGVESLEHAIRPVPPLRRPLSQRGPDAQPSSAAILRALQALPDHQPLNQENRSVHAAALCQNDGTIRLCREDVGRHNALDKLIGAATRQGMALDEGFVVMSSRCSFELVQKAITLQIPLLATLSAPTSLALSEAKQAGLALAARGPAGSLVRFGKAE